MKSADLNDLLIQMKITNRLLAAQLRGSMGQKDLVGVLLSTGATHGDIAVPDTSAGTVKITALRIRNEKRGKRNRRRGGRRLEKSNG